jgi:hypothetical protein
MKWPWVKRSTYEYVRQDRDEWHSAFDRLWGDRKTSDAQLAVARTQTATVTDAQVRQVVLAIDSAASQIVAAVKSNP